jgi:ABC-2 type transport system permease protein
MAHQQAHASALMPSVEARAPAPKPSLWLSVGTLWLREIRSFYRQRSRVIGGLATPLVFWILLGSGFGSSLLTQGGTGGYLQFFYPGSVTLVVLFTSLFANISVIEDRREGFLLSVLVAPVSSRALVLGKVLGATTIGFLQGLVFLPLAPLAGISVELAKLPAIFAVIFLMAFTLTSLGFFFAWWLNSVQGFHSVMNVVLMPMWMLSGAVFPPEGASGWVRAVMMANPLTYGVSALRHLLHDGDTLSGIPSLEFCWLMLAVCAVLAIGAALWRASVRSANDLSS